MRRYPVSYTHLVGRDLRPVKYIIAVGGVFTHADDELRARIMEKALEDHGISLLPDPPVLLTDKAYVLYAMGILAEKKPDIALKWIRKYFGI